MSSADLFERVIVSLMGAGKTPPGGYPPPVGTVPMLSRVPAGELMDSPRRAPVRRTAEVLYSDTSWRPCQIVAWARHQGGWAALIRWPDGREDWRQFNRRPMRPRAHQDSDSGLTRPARATPHPGARAWTSPGCPRTAAATGTARTPHRPSPPCSEPRTAAGAARPGRARERPARPTGSR